MVYPIEIAQLPQSLKQDLLDAGVYYFPPKDIDEFFLICEKHGYPRKEGLRFIADFENPCLHTHKEVHPKKETIWGPPGSGKTRYCLRETSAHIIASHKATATYIDCDGNFSCQVLYGLGISKVEMSRVTVLRALSPIDLLAACHIGIKPYHPSQEHLVVIDSIASVLRHEEPSVVLNTIRAISSILASSKCIVVNQTTKDISTDSFKPCFELSYERYFSPPGWVKLKFLCILK
jgi:hypothetical protein